MDYLLVVGGDPYGRCAGLILAAHEHDNASYTTRRQWAATARHMSYLRAGKQAGCDQLEAPTLIVLPPPRRPHSHKTNIRSRGR